MKTYVYVVRYKWPVSRPAAVFTTEKKARAMMEKEAWYDRVQLCRMELDVPFLTAVDL
jgi:hypothetical protein